MRNARPRPAGQRRKPAEYRHKEEALARPDVGTQPQFRKKAPPKTWHYDSSLAPALEQREALIAQLERSIAALRQQQVLRAYEYKDDWVNRMILGDSLAVMNSRSIWRKT